LNTAIKIGKNLIVAIVDRNYIGLKVRIRNERLHKWKCKG
jgi:hypothetical protein